MQTVFGSRVKPACRWLSLTVVALGIGCQVPQRRPEPVLENPLLSTVLFPPAETEQAQVAANAPAATIETVHVAYHGSPAQLAAQAEFMDGPLPQPAPENLEVAPFGVMEHGTLAGPAPAATLEISFLSAFSLASGQNPEILFADARVREAIAQLQAARVLWLPSIRAGVNWNKHDGRLQDVEGEVRDISRANLYSGLGAAAVGAGSPAVPGVLTEFHTADALFQPRIAGYRAQAQQSAARAATEDVLLNVSLAYIDLLTASQQQAIAEETLANSQRLADVARSFAEAGEGAQADADRTLADLAVRRNELLRAEERLLVASVRLAELLGLDPQTRFVPAESQIAAVDLVPPQASLQELLATGLSNRAELAQSRSLVCAAVNRLRREAYAPLVPSVLLGVSYGGFGGGTGSDIDNFGDRLDVDAVAFWELRNLGFGERAARSEARALLDQAELREVALMDQVAREIAEAHVQVVVRQRQIVSAESGVDAALSSYQRNVERIRAGQGLPIEVLQSIQALDQARREYLRSVAEYDQAQLRLYRALGWPGTPLLP